MPKTPYDAVLNAARDLPRVGSALAAEMLGATLLGSVYSLATDRRAAAVEEFVAGFLAHTGRRRTDAARVTRAVFAALVPGAAGADRVRVRPGAHTPDWVAELGRVELRGSWAYGDVFGDQTSYLATFGYQRPEAGGDEHAVVVLVDHNIGIVKDLFVGEPAGKLREEVRQAATADELVWLSEVEPAVMRAQIEHHLAVTDGLGTLPDGGSLATDRMLVGARLALLPDGASAATPTVPDQPALVEAFLGTPEAGALTATGEVSADSLRYAVRLILEFVQDGPDGDPLRWSPAVVGLFLLDWLQRRAVLDDGDVSALPPVVRAWAGWAARQRGLPPAALAAIDEAVDLMAPEFVRLYATGERRPPEVTAMAGLLADGVDPSDEPAVAQWLQRHGDDHDNGTGDAATGQVPRPR